MLPPPSLSNWQNNGLIINSLLCIKAFFFSYFMLIWVLYEQWLTITLQGTQKVVSLILEVNMAQVAGVTSLYVMYSSAFLILLHMICLIRKCTEAGLTHKRPLHQTIEPLRQTLTSLNQITWAPVLLNSDSKAQSPIYWLRDAVFLTEHNAARRSWVWNQTGLGASCMEFACPLWACVGSLQIPQLLPTQLVILIWSYVWMWVWRFACPYVLDWRQSIAIYSQI